MIRGFPLSVALLNAWIEDLADGITVLRGVGELFESGDVQPAQIDKTIVERSYMPGHLQVIYDRSYDNAEDLARDQFVCCHAERRHCSAVRWKAVRSLLA